MQKSNYIITGGGGSGKTSIINHLNKLGYSTCYEVSRQIIKEQQAIDGNLLPWQDLFGFGMECINRMQKQLKESDNQICFFDRGLPDIQAYFNTQNLKTSTQHINVSEKYSQTVFICPPWKEIFVNDPQRPESFDYSCTIYQNLKKEYLKSGFKLVIVPKLPIVNRAEFILNHIRKETFYLKGTSNLLPSVAK